jgi:hypothetical protein
VLTKRVEAAVAVWTAAFATTATSSTATDSNTATATTTAGATAGAHSLQLQPSVHEVLLRNGVLHLHPSLEQARHTWIRHLHSHVCTAALLPRLRSSRFAVFDEHDVSHSSSSGGTGTAAAGTVAADSYAEAVMKRLPVTVLQSAYTEIEAQLGRVGEYVGLWLRYQSLWNVTTQVRGYVYLVLCSLHCSLAVCQKYTHCVSHVIIASTTTAQRTLGAHAGRSAEILLPCDLMYCALAVTPPHCATSTSTATAVALPLTQSLQCHC